MCPLTIDICTEIVNYFFYLLELAGKSDTVIQSGTAECMTLVNNNQRCCLTIVLSVIVIQTYRNKCRARNKTIAHVCNE